MLGAMQLWKSPLVQTAAMAAVATSIALFGTGCGGTSSDVFGGDDDGEGQGGAATGAGPGSSTTGVPVGSTGTQGTTATTTTVGPGGTSSSSQGPGGGGPVCDSGPDEDFDGDGFTPNTGDCNDCDADVSPDDAEIGGNGVDDDCDGELDEVGSCDAGLPVDNGDPLTAAQAIGLCATPANDGYGLLDARWIRANGVATNQNLQGGVLPNFGPNVPPLEGDRVLALSTGRARLPGSGEECGTNDCQGPQGTPPFGFPTILPNCATPNGSIFDDIGLEVTVRAPENATGYRYRYRFYSFEFPEWVCTEFTDQFVTLASPAPDGAMGGNLSFEGNLPLSVNVPIDSCTSCVPWAENCISEALSDPDIDCPAAPSPCCPGGNDALEGTGFDTWSATSGAGATAWLETRAPIVGGQEVTLQFIIWDTTDAILDSTVVIDDFAWITGGDVEVETVPVD